MGATLIQPSAVANVPIGVIVGWWLPVCPGTSPSINQRAAWKSMKFTIVSSNDVCTHWPRPVRSRAMSAASTPCASTVPDAVSEMAMPTRDGPVPGGPVTLMRPPSPCAIWSTPGCSA